MPYNSAHDGPTIDEGVSKGLTALQPEDVAAVATSGSYNDLADKPAIPLGDVVGPSSATDNAVVRFDQTTGKLIQNSGVGITDSGQINLPVVETPASPSSNTLGLFASKLANKLVGKLIDPSGFHTFLQPALFAEHVAQWLPGAGSTVAINYGVSWTALNSGTGTAQSTPSVALTSDVTAMKRGVFGTGTTATGASGIRSSLADFVRGNSAGRGGFLFHARLGVEVFASDLRLLIGFTSSSGALAAEPSTYSHACGLIKDSTDSNWHFFTNAADGVGTKVNTGVVVDSTTALDFYMFCEPNGNSIFFALFNAKTKALLASHEATTDLPGSSTFMYARAGIQSQSGLTAKELAVNKIYIATSL